MKDVGNYVMQAAYLMAVVALVGAGEKDAALGVGVLYVVWMFFGKE